MDKKSSNIHKKIKIEEQKILLRLIAEIDSQILEVNSALDQEELDRIKADGQNLSDSYAQVMHCNYMKEMLEYRQQNLIEVRDELYDTRIVVDVMDGKGIRSETRDIKIGLHGLHYKGRVYVMSWVLPVCRYYLLDQSGTDFRMDVSDEYGRKESTNYRLRLKRKVDIHFDRVRNAVQMYPLIDEEAEWIVSDEFLQTLLERRSEYEFRNIVFSIQKKQGEIIARPYNENLIVQGCAGSGKSMIMMHRLPILMYDNIGQLGRNSIYVITPSEAYIQMAQLLRADLEIEDLRMGTIQQYYDYVLERYGIKAGAYGNISHKVVLSLEQEQYVYSDDCTRDIREEIRRLTSTGHDSVLQIPKNPALTDYRRQLLVVRQDILDVRKLIQKRREMVQKQISQQITTVSYSLATNQERLLRMMQSKQSKTEGDQRRIIAYKQKEYRRLNALLKEVIHDREYHENSKVVARLIADALESVGLTNTPGKNYARIISKSEIVGLYNAVSDALQQLDPKYDEFFDCVPEHLYELKEHADALLQCIDTLLSRSTEKIADSNGRYTNFGRALIDSVYMAIMGKIDPAVAVSWKGNGKSHALECSPYIYTRIAYMLKGAPLSGHENLISIDEAQSLAPCELELIRGLNNNKVVINLYGDVNQHILGTRGVDEWSDFDGVMPFTQYTLDQNYRNARQITEYCNRCFDLHMEAINLPGSGVHELSGDPKDLDSAVSTIWSGSGKGVSRAIIVHSFQEALYIADRYCYKPINNMATGASTIDPRAWNIMTVRQSRGLEFGSVIVVTSGMARNERYIAYTRALDELYIYDHQIGSEIAEDIYV